MSSIDGKDPGATKPTEGTGIETEYANTDFDLKSESPFDTLHRELDRTCCVLHYERNDDGHWISIVESAVLETRHAETDILALIDVIHGLSPAAKSELDACYLREFNIGFTCGDTWAYTHTLLPTVVQAVAQVGCSLTVTLYPSRRPDGSPMEPIAAEEPGARNDDPDSVDSSSVPGPADVLPGQGRH